MSEIDPIIEVPIVPPVVIPPVVEPEPEPEKPAAIPPSKDVPNPYVEKYALKLKAELGEKYSPKFDKMNVNQRIDAMEASIDVLSKQVDPLKKGETNTPLGEQAPIMRKNKTTLELQQEDGYGKKLRHRKSAYHRTSARLNKI